NGEKITGPLTANELICAEKCWVRCVQQTEFAEYAEIKDHKSVVRSSKLFSLNPILTEDGLLCLGGRLQKSDFNFHEKHPLILPSKSRFSQLLISREHQRLHHAGVSETLTQIREKFWILCGRQTVKSRLNKCLICRRFEVSRGNQIMAPLPENRIQAIYPFENVGIDFAGPLYTMNTDKAYIALFTCVVTRAIHLEVVSSLSTEHFLLAFRRFIYRRGICRTVNSDNAMTFKSADIELERLYMNISEPEAQNYFGKKGIKWQYIVERAAWWGGYWERMVQMTKVALRKILGKALVTSEELQTILAEIEAIFNSRPLTYVYNEPDEPFPLTPANFLTGRRLTVLPNWSGSRKFELFKGKRELIKRFLYREMILNNFWKRWKREYLLPLTYVYNEPDEPFPLTPANFLTGRRLTVLPNWSGSRKYELFKGKRELIKRFLYREMILNNYWKRWKREYLLPLTYVYNEPDEPFPLTPANFLTGRRLTVLPNWSGSRKSELFKGKRELIKRFLYREMILNNFWKRWKREYLLPLTYVYNEPDEPFPLTPANFLTGRRLTVLPNWSGSRKSELFKGKRELIKRFLYRERILNNFWKRWKREYLLQLKGANFNKNVNVKTEFNVNNIVLLGEEKVPRQLWRLGKIIDVHKGRDGKVRSATIKTATGMMKRPIQLLYNLEIMSKE
ncbi:hypothetical protein AVEN_65561-1, partial [Araneus ventricosus]